MVTTPIAITNALLPFLKKYIPPPEPAPAAGATQSEATPAAADTTKENGAPNANGSVPDKTTEPSHSAEPTTNGATDATAPPATDTTTAPSTDASAAAAAPTTTAPATGKTDATPILNSSGNPVSKDEL